jgi:hypothetical protein
MATFTPGTTVTTAEPVIAVDPGVRPGTHVFSLVVEDDQGNRSDEARATVTVRLGHGPLGPFQPGHPIVLDPNVLDPNLHHPIEPP